MDTGTIITSVLFLAVSIMPFVLVRRSVKRKEKRLQTLLKNLAEEQQCQITLYDIGNDFAIGLDEKTNMLFVYSKNKDTEQKTHVDLQKIRECKLLNTKRAISNTADHEMIIEKLELILTGDNANQTVIEFYNADHFRQLSDELQLIEKWNKLMNNRLN